MKAFLLAISINYFKEVIAMIEIVKRGQKEVHQIECVHCHSILNFEDNDMFEKSFMEDCRYITCPVCNEDICVILDKDVMYKNIKVNI